MTWLNQPKRDKFGKIIEPLPEGAPITRLEQFLREGNGNFDNNVALAKKMRKAQADQYVDWLLARVDPEMVAEVALEALTIAREKKSHQGMLQILKFIMEYTVGRPVERKQHEFGANAGDWVDVFADNRQVLDNFEVEDHEIDWLKQQLMKKRDAERFAMADVASVVDSSEADDE